MAALLEEARAKQDLPALADPNAVLQPQTSLENTFTCQPQQRNMHGRVFGGFLMRRAFELAHSTAYMFAGARPATGMRARPRAVRVQVLHACVSMQSQLCDSHGAGGRPTSETD